MPQHTTDFIPRVNEEDELSYDPDTLAPKKPKPESRPQAVTEALSGPLPPETPIPANLTEAVPTTPVTAAAPIAADTAPQQQLAPKPSEERNPDAIAVTRDLPGAPDEEARQIEEEDEEELEYEVSRVRGSL